MDTTQDIDIYFNFIGEYRPRAMEMPELTAEEIEEMQKKEALRNKRHEQYLKRKASGKQKEYEERYNKRRKERMERMRAERRAEDIEAGIYREMGVAEIPIMERVPPLYARYRSRLF